MVTLSLAAMVVVMEVFSKRRRCLTPTLRQLRKEWGRLHHDKLQKGLSGRTPNPASTTQIGFVFLIMKYSEFFHTIQGEGKLVGVPSVFFRTSYCNLRCAWCSAIGTRVLTSDLRWIPIENLNPGDWVVGALRQDKGGHLQLQPTQVIETAVRRAPMVRFLTEDGIQFACSSDHLLYQVTTRTQDSSKIHVGWRKARNLSIGRAVRCVLPPEDLQVDM